MITTTYGGRLGNLLLEMYTCVWYARKQNIPNSEVMFSSIYRRDGSLEPDDNYIETNKPIFENISHFLVKADEYDTELEKQKPEMAGLQRALRSNSKNVVFPKYTYHYPADIADRSLFQDLFSVNSIIEEQLESHREYFSKKDPVALHVRRTDYATFKDGQLLETAQCINKKLDRYKGCTVVVFSDDIAWCRENLSNEKCEFLFHECQSPAYKDMILMSLFGSIESNAHSSYSYCAKLLDKNIKSLPKRA
jgi:hypothetical protein